jgi:two-component system, sensor histidine kinase and response regulator
LIVANKELAIQNEEKEKWAAELAFANRELVLQNNEKEKRAAELVVANIELAFQNNEKEKRAAELVIANKELAFQNEEKDKRAAELVIANKELAFQTIEKGRQALQTDELKEQNLELEMQKRQLDEASKLKSAFLSNMSHELRTPLNAIVGFSELALKTNLTTQQTNYLSKIKISSHILLGLIGDILDLSKIEANKLELEIIAFNLEDVLQKTISQVSVQSHEKGLNLTVAVDEDVPKHLIGDPLRLGQILSNLSSNAVKFTEAGDIIICIKMLESYENIALIQFSVQDTGIGITEEQIQKLFQPFTQADTSSTRKYGGTGLGLSISQKLVNRMGGDIWVKSEAGVGSTFFFTIKINIADAAADKEQFRLYRDHLKKWEMKVLVVDDKEESRDIIGSMLTDMSLDVTMCSSGKEAIKILRKTNEEKRYDLIIMDWKMPEMDGIEASAHIKKLFAPEIAPAVIMLTAYSEEGVQEKAEKAGLHGAVLYKPVTPSLLFNAIIHVCDKEGLEQNNADTVEIYDTEQLPNLRNIRVLLAEDNEINLEVAREILHEAGLIVTIANNGKEAVEKVKVNTYDIILMDIQMPIMDGYDAVREIRKNPAFSDLPIIAMTANALLSDQQRALKAGMNDYVAKPIDSNQLFQKILLWVKRDVLPEKAMLDVSAQFISLSNVFPPASMPELPGIDIKAGLDRLGGNRKLYFELLLKFRKNHINAAKEIKYALAHDGPKKAEIMAHTIKGAAGTLGVKDVYTNSGTIETMIRNNRPDQAELLLEKLTQALEQAYASIALLEKNTENPQISHAAKTDVSQLEPLLVKLEKLLSVSDMDAVDYTEEIIDHTKNTLLAEKAAKMKDCADHYEFEKALGLLSEMLDTIRGVSGNEKGQ